MKVILTLLLTFSLVLTFFLTYGQGKKLKEYTAFNGTTYKPGDIIKLGKGSAPNGDFVYLQIGGWAAGTGASTIIGSSYAGLAVEVKKIKEYNFKGQEKVAFTVDGGNITNYLLMIEDAIATCEVADCNNELGEVQNSTTDKYDELKKLKELLDSGVLTQEEYESEKRKVLEGN